ncbi:MAG TPA: type II toxin-antitoxin system Phd/YefM family antitoxin [Vicinamibacterales bacterium]|jgi:antitoxin Phd|nr:type II toxin-antitoxin system Phd/YefM family antitoxin [Vicinamibacterales bacterium]
MVVGSWRDNTILELFAYFDHFVQNSRVGSRIVRKAKPRILFRTRRGEERSTPSVSATKAKTEFGRVLDMAIQGDAVIITKHDSPKAVLVSFEEFNALVQAKKGVLDTLSDEFDELLAQMQAPNSRAAMKAAFGATPAQLGEAAVAAARRRE